MNCLVTGVAGFIGSNLARRLLADGHSVAGIDCFTDYYPRWMKERNLEPLRGRRGFAFTEADLDEADLPALLEGREAVFHLAAQAGVRASWGRSFSHYLKDNISVTQKLLEAARETRPRRFVYASSSSVYGLVAELPMRETATPRPVSPYGVSKLAAEQLGFLYFHNHGVPAVALRFFTVYGPGQRPDMAFHKFFRALAEGGEIPVFGDGRQTRDFTYVDDIVAALVAAADRGRPGEAYNVGGGHRERLLDVVALMGEVSGRAPRLRFLEPQKGDVPDTHADTTKAAADLDYRPRTDLRAGLEAEWRWVRDLHPPLTEGTSS